MTVLEKLLLPEIRELIAEHDEATLRETLNRWLPADVGDLLRDLDSQETVVAFQCLDLGRAGATFVYLPRTAQDELLDRLPEDQVARILNELPPDDRTAYLE